MLAAQLNAWEAMSCAHLKMVIMEDLSDLPLPTRDTPTRGEKRKSIHPHPSPELSLLVRLRLQKPGWYLLATSPLFQSLTHR